MPTIFNSLSSIYAGTCLEALTESIRRNKPTKDSIVLLAEFCNYSAKLARNEHKNLLTSGKRKQANLYDIYSKKLMATSKCYLFYMALDYGCAVYKTDDCDPNAVIMRGDKHQAGFHVFNKNLLKSIPLCPNETPFTGFERQWLAPVIYKAFLQKHPFADLVAQASTNIEEAQKLNEKIALSGFSATHMKHFSKNDLLNIADSFSKWLGLDEHQIASSPLNFLIFSDAIPAQEGEKKVKKEASSFTRRGPKRKKTYKRNKKSRATREP